MSQIWTIFLCTLLFSNSSYAENITKTAIQNDNKLNIAYKTAMSFLNKKQKNKLRDAQRLWIKYRDATCDFENSIAKNKHWIEEDVSQLKNIECISRLSVTRAKELNDYSESISIEVHQGVITGASAMMITPGSSQISHTVTVELTKTNSRVTFLFPLNTRVKIGDKILLKEFKAPFSKRSAYSFIRYLE